MGPRRVVDVVTENRNPDLQEQYEDLAAQHEHLRAVINKKTQDLREDLERRHAGMVQLVSSLKNSIYGIHLQQQLRENASTYNVREIGAQTKQGILGPNPYCNNSNSRGHNLLFP